MLPINMDEDKMMCGMHKKHRSMVERGAVVTATGIEDFEAETEKVHPNDAPILQDIPGARIGHHGRKQVALPSGRPGQINFEVLNISKPVCLVPDGVAKGYTFAFSSGWQT